MAEDVFYHVYPQRWVDLLVGSSLWLIRNEREVIYDWIDLVG